MCPRVLQFESEKRQPVHEQHHVDFQTGVGHGEGLLACEGELVLGIFLFRSLAVGC